LLTVNYCLHFKLFKIKVVPQQEGITKKVFNVFESSI